MGMNKFMDKTIKRSTDDVMAIIDDVYMRQEYQRQVNQSNARRDGGQRIRRMPNETDGN